ncbi:MAG: hypothetical protein ABI778_07885, partial [Ignavibacteriota bacterium]
MWRRLLAFVRAAGTRAALNALFGFLSFAVIMAIDLVANSLKTIQGSVLDILRTVLLIVGLFFWSRAVTPFIVRYRDLSRSVGSDGSSRIPLKVLRWFVYTLAVACFFSFLPDLFNLSVTPAFEPKTPNTVSIIDMIGSIWFIGFSVLLVGFARFLFLWQRTAELRRRFVIWLIPIILFSIAQYLNDRHPLPEDTMVTITLLGLRSLVVFATLFLWFRVQWMPHVSRSQKNGILIYSALASLLSLAAFILYFNAPALERYAIMLASGMTVTLLALSSYFGLIFFNALFTLSSSELVERRAAEVKSLANLTKFSSD